MSVTYSRGSNTHIDNFNPNRCCERKLSCKDKAYIRNNNYYGNWWYLVKIKDDEWRIIKLKNTVNKIENIIIKTI